MPLATRFTTHYDIREDRIRLAFEQKDESKCVLWLTRRLLSRLIPQIVKILESQTSAGKFMGGQRDKGARAEGIQRFNQQAAVSGIGLQKPVQVPESDLDPQTFILVAGLSLILRRNKIVVEFKDGDTVYLAIPFSATDLRQWLAVLAHCYKQAQWRENFWPGWMKAGGKEPNILLN